MNPRYIYFDKTTGVILDILKTRKRGRAKYVTVDLETVRPILEGTMGTHELVVAYDHDKEDFVLLEKDNIIKLRHYSKELYKIPNKVIEDYDLRIDLFTAGNGMEVSIDPSRMSTMYSTDFRDEVCFEKGTEIRIYVKDKVGEELLKTVVIDAQRLLENGQLFYALDVDPNDVSFYVERVFDNYMWRKGIAKFMSPMKDMIRFEIQKADLKRRSPKYEYHLQITSAKDGIEILNNIENVKLVKIFDEIEFYLVDKYDPTIMYEKFVLQPKSFKREKIYVRLKETLEGKTILYNHKHISVLIEDKS